MAATRRRLPSAAWLALIPFAAIALLVAWGFGYFDGPPPWRDLPADASDVHWAALDVFPDFDTWVQAKLPDASCRKLVSERYAELQPLDRVSIPKGEEHWLTWSYPQQPLGVSVDWWTAGEMRPENTWVRRNGDLWAIVQCAEGHVYMHFFSH